MSTDTATYRIGDQAGRLTWIWPALGVLALGQIAYPLVSGGARAGLVVVTVVLGFAISLAHAWRTRGPRVAGALVLVTAGGLAVEVLGVATGIPFGRYGYDGTLGPRVWGVPLIIPLAWAWMAWPAWLAAGRLTTAAPRRVPLAGLALAAWDLFLDPQMVDAGYWHWDPSTTPTLPAVPGIPVTNYLGWLVVACAMMAALAVAAGPAGRSTGRGSDAPMLALYLWTYASSVLAHAVFLGLPASAAWGAIGMGLVAVPLAARLVRA